MAEGQDTVDLEGIRDDPFLAPFTRPFKDLGRDEKDPGSGFRAIAAALDDVRENGLIQVTLRMGRKRQHWCLALTPSGCEVSEGHSEQPDLEILTDGDTWSKLTRGELSPLAAFVAGRVRVLGSVDLARAMVTRLS